MPTAPGRHHRILRAHSLAQRALPGARYLLAPWIAGAGRRDLLRPDVAAHDLDVSARQPREATGGAALLARSRLACVNLWDFADQRLPQGGGEAVWSCSRAVTRRGCSEVPVHLRADGPDPARVVARARDTAARSRFGRHVVAGARRLSPKGDRYVLTAGSRAETGRLATGEDVPAVPTLADPDRP
ncbi:hypothetical protein [Streptomyces sp. AC512_CC834]|uniref:hypothetical protein n=1 Tax=Streptomyces sp. AC512_CC834 TaxID=2823691 RepID=UPI001C27576F|nr:hypothetical protein [Streptomyces sp. AC512_CC834]